MTEHLQPKHGLYYALTGIACAVYYRRQLTRSVSTFLLVGVGPVAGALMLVWLLVLSTVCIAAAGYIINDYYDVKIDAINKPGRLLVGRLIRRRRAMFAHLILSGAGVLMGLLLSIPVALINLGAVLLLWSGLSTDIAGLAIAGRSVGEPLWVERISGSLPRLPTRMTLLTLPAIGPSPCS